MKKGDTYRIYQSKKHNSFYEISDDVSRGMIWGMDLIISGLTVNEVIDFRIFCKGIDNEFKQ